VTGPWPLGRRPDSVRRAVARSRAVRLRAVERRLTRHLRFLKRHDPDGHVARLSMLRKVIERGA